MHLERVYNTGKVGSLYNFKLVQAPSLVRDNYQLDMHMLPTPCSMSKGAYIASIFSNAVEILSTTIAILVTYNIKNWN